MLNSRLWLYDLRENSVNFMEKNAAQQRIQEYFDRNQWLKVLFVFDTKGFLVQELEGLEWPADFHFEIFDGAWFNAKYAIENTWKDKKTVLLFPNAVCPQNEEQRLKFPLLDILLANMEYKEESYDAFLQQYNLPQRFGGFIKRNIDEIKRARVFSILEGYLTPELFKEDVVVRAMISSYFGEKKMLEWPHIIVKLLIVGVNPDDKKGIDIFHKISQNKDVREILDAKLISIFGTTYSNNSAPVMKPVAESLKYNSITQLLVPSADDPYKLMKVAGAVALEQINRIFELGHTDRQYADKFKPALATLASAIREDELINAYGIDAPYFNMTETLGWPIVKQVIKEQVAVEPQSAIEKVRELRMKFVPESQIQSMLEFAENTAMFYDKLKAVGTTKIKSPDEYVIKYVSEYYLLDTYYRRAVGAYLKSVRQDAPIAEDVADVKAQLDIDYAKFANVLNLEWMDCVNNTDGKFQSLSATRQDKFFEKYFDPSLKKQVVIISDALRYEVAAELMEELSKRDKNRHVAELQYMVATLPTETKYCKPALFPHNSLEFEDADMAVDGKILSTTELRTAQLQKYKANALCITYEEVMDGSVMSKRDIFKLPLVYVMHNVIDKEGHDGNLPDACTKAVEELADLISRIHSSWNVGNLYLTSDHGFLFNDIKFEEKDKHKIEEQTVDKKTRYYITPYSTPQEGLTKFKLSEVSSIKSSIELYVAVPDGTNRLAAPGGYKFAHGGATLQGMVVPVIYSNKRNELTKEKVGVSLVSHNLNMVSSQLKFQLIQTEPVSMQLTQRVVTCQVFNGDKPVTNEERVTLKGADMKGFTDRIFDVTLRLNQPLEGNLLQLRVSDVDDLMNPLIKETVKNNTIIEQDF